MKRILSLALMVLYTLTVRAQQAEIRPDDPAFISKYSTFDFKGKFSSFIDKDAVNNYYLVDLLKLPSRFERVYFMNICFSYDEIVNIDPDISKSRVCFMANVKFKKEDICKLFEEMEQKVLKTSSTWSEGKKATWLNENDKYK